MFLGAELPIRVVCSCGRELNAPDGSGGKKGRCQACGSILTIPEDPVMRDRGAVAISPDVLVPAFHPEATIGSSQAASNLVSINSVQPRHRNALAVASLGLGILAALVCWVPFVGLLAIPFGLLGLVLGTIALTLVMMARRSGLAAAAGGAGLSVVAMLASLAITGFTSQRTSTAFNDAVKNYPVAQAVPVVPPAAPPGAPQGQAPAPQRDGMAPPIAGLPKRAIQPRLVETSLAGKAFVSFPNSAQIANVQVRVARVVRGKVPMIDKIPAPSQNPRGESEDELLSIYLEITNLDDGRKIDFTSFAGVPFSEDGAKLSDDLGNHYRRMNFGFSNRPAGRTESGSLYPGKKVSDHLVFELPVEKASFLMIEMPASHVQLDKGIFRFKIPTTAIER